MPTDIKPEIAQAMHLVGAWKQDALVSVQAEIIRVAMRKSYFSPADIAEDIVTDADRQGVASNGWNALRAAGVIDRLPVTFTNAALGIYGGRVQNTNPRAKGRWVAAYQLVSLALAREWMTRHNQPLTLPGPAQLELEISNDTKQTPT